MIHSRSYTRKNANFFSQEHYFIEFFDTETHRWIAVDTDFRSAFLHAKNNSLINALSLIKEESYTIVHLVDDMALITAGNANRRVNLDTECIINNKSEYYRSVFELIGVVENGRTFYCNPKNVARELIENYINENDTNSELMEIKDFENRFYAPNHD